MRTWASAVERLSLKLVVPSFVVAVAFLVPVTAAQEGPPDESPPGEVTDRGPSYGGPQRLGEPPDLGDVVLEEPSESAVVVRNLRVSRLAE